MNIFQMQFATGTVCDAAGVNEGALQNWLRRGLLVGQKDSPIMGGGSPGRHRRFTFFNVMEIAVAKSLTDLGVDVATAFLAAREFAHTGEGPLPNIPERSPGVVFDWRAEPIDTFVAVAGDFHAVGCLRPENNTISVIQEALRYKRNFSYVDANEIFNRATTVLGFAPRDVLASAYDNSN
jgi:hypothetical protein